jgi:LuxR family maltose regulon positive regulatory protein
MGLGCLRAIAYLKEGRSDHATDALVTSLRTAERLGTMQSIVDDRRRLAPILSAAVRQSGVKMHALDEPGDEARTVYVEPLSPRELTVLEHMATHMSYPEIADELYVSPSTVRSHVKSIYRKLAVNRRTEAVSQGRAYGLIR